MPSTHGHGLKRAVLWAILYARVSTDEQARSGYSLAQQLEALREYAAREGYEVLEEVVDPGQSGASLERPGMDRVRDLVAAGGVYVMLAQDRDRFAREPAYHYLLRSEFEEHGTKIRALLEGSGGATMTTPGGAGTPYNSQLQPSRARLTSFSHRVGTPTLRGSDSSLCPHSRHPRK
ncbi:MAG TPA: recombinase family protein [Rubrobacter sp.]|nr:recombinase family protein [Rubrobacter sp.]